MAKAKTMNEVRFAKIVKELDSVGELIRTKQNEKQSVMDDFEKEKKRLKTGRISKDTLASSALKVNKELNRLDKDIRTAIVKVGKISGQSREFAAMQRPKVFRTSVSGIRLSGASKPKPAKKKAVKRKPVKKKAAPKVKNFHKKHGVRPSKNVLAKEKALDKKFSKKK